MKFTLDLYKPNEVEHWIADKYRANGILRASDMDIDRIAAIFGIQIQSYNGPTFIDWADGEYALMFINYFLGEKKVRKAFFHELSHPLLHAGRQDSKSMPKAFRVLQEAQAASFQLYAAMPWYMLQEFEGFSHDDGFIKQLSEAFRLPKSLVKTRLDQITRRVSQASYDRNLSVLFSNIRSLSYRTENEEPLSSQEDGSAKSQDHDGTISVLYKYDSFYGRDTPNYIVIDTDSIDWSKILLIRCNDSFEDSAYDESSSDQVVVSVPRQAYVVNENEWPGKVGISMPILKEYLENSIDFAQRGYSHTDIERLTMKIDEVEETFHLDIRTAIQKEKFQEEWF